MLFYTIVSIVARPELIVPGGPFQEFDVSSISNGRKQTIAYDRGRTLYAMSTSGTGALLVLIACVLTLCTVSTIVCYISLAFENQLIQKIHVAVLVSFE